MPNLKNDSNHYGLTFLRTIGKQLNTDSNKLKCQKIKSYYWWLQSSW